MHHTPRVQTKHGLGICVVPTVGCKTTEVPGVSNHLGTQVPGHCKGPGADARQGTGREDTASGASSLSPYFVISQALHLNSPFRASATIPRDLPVQPQQHHFDSTSAYARPERTTAASHHNSLKLQPPSCLGHHANMQIFSTWVLLASAALGAVAAEDLKIDVTVPVECDRKTQSGDKVQMHYRGTLAADGKQFDASMSRPASSPRFPGCSRGLYTREQGLHGHLPLATASPMR